MKKSFPYEESKAFLNLPVYMRYSEKVTYPRIAKFIKLVKMTLWMNSVLRECLNSVRLLIILNCNDKSVMKLCIVVIVKKSYVCIFITRIFLEERSQ